MKIPCELLPCAAHTQWLVQSRRRVKCALGAPASVLIQPAASIGLGRDSFIERRNDLYQGSLSPFLCLKKHLMLTLRQVKTVKHQPVHFPCSWRGSWERRGGNLSWEGWGRWGEAPVGQVIGDGGASSVFPQGGWERRGFYRVASLTSPQIAQLPVTPSGRNQGPFRN